MKRSFGTGFTLILCAAVFFSSMMGYVFGVRANRDEESRAVQREQQAVGQTKNAAAEEDTVVLKKEDKITQKYILRKDGEGVSLFVLYSDGREELYQSYDISVSSLPEADRDMLSQGIELSSLSGALQTVEDYLS